MCRGSLKIMPRDGYRASPLLHTMKQGKEAILMEGVLFMLGTIVIEGGLVLLLMSLLTASDREQRREEERLRRLAPVAGKGLRRAA